MRLQFPDGFFWGTSTAAAQVETAYDHQWKGLTSKDGYTFLRTSDHEKRREEDAEYIAQLGSYYRCGVDWSRLQNKAFAPFDIDVVEEYQAFFADLRHRGTKIMFVVYHFSHPRWFAEANGWLEEDNIDAYLDFTAQCIEHFGEYVSNWNTVNEPNVYASSAYFTGDFPPHKKSYFQANRVIANLGRGHDLAYDMIKKAYPDHPVGISYNTVYFEGLNFLGRLRARFSDWWFNQKAASYFTKVDYWGLSYYAHILFTPAMLTASENGEELKRRGYPTDKMWAYYPEGFGKILQRFSKKYGKPIVITENGICSDDPRERVQCLKDYLQVIHEAMEDGVEVLGYIHWSTWDNFEWHLGPTFRFGLVRINLDTMDREMTEAAYFYQKITSENAIDI